MPGRIVDLLKTLPPRHLKPGERAMVAEWLAAAGDIASAYFSEREHDDPAIYRRIVITEGKNSGPTFLIHTPANMKIWIVLCVGSPSYARGFDSLRDALNFVRPVLLE
jgi:hypothetical protein